MENDKDEDKLFEVFNEKPVTEEDIAVEEEEINDKKRTFLKEYFENKKKSKKNEIKEKEEVKAVISDEVEIEASRKVAFSVGLLGNEEEVKGEEDLQLSHQVRHQVAIPQGYPYVPIGQHRRKQEARKYPFPLDPFQDTAISCIDRNESVLVSAHTSAGKTVVAEYAIAKSFEDKQRIIYTSPIKALSNQKYRELLSEFKDVGLMTGDVTINSDAGCLVMTTEILRSMLYRGSEVIREVAWIVFDEVHYMRDKSRGVVWEETIILLPDNVHYVFLSATIPNAMEFAKWIVKIHLQPCHVVYTDFRPTPLQHYLFPSGSDGIHLVMDEKGTFREENFQKAMALINNGPSVSSASDKLLNKSQSFKASFRDSKSDIYKIVKMIYMKNYNPVIVFSFSKKDCERLALKMSKLSFNSDSENETLDKIFANAIKLLSESDTELPQIKNILPLLKRGIGIHHSGLLPILKEIIEILFQEGLIKVLFATETFSIGLNMPAKTVIFTSVRKWDGIGFRWVSGGEYIQMSGRAGRRGLDDRGIVIMMIDEKIEPEIAKSMVMGQSDRLDSAFHLGYNMILNLIRVEGISSEFMLRNSFFQFQNVSSISSLDNELSDLKKEYDDIIIKDESLISELYDQKNQIEKYNDEISKIITSPKYILSFLQTGRVIEVEINGINYGLGMVLSYTKINSKKSDPKNFSYIVTVFVYKMFVDSPVKLIKPYSTLFPSGIRPAKPNEKTRSEFIPINLASIKTLSLIRLRTPDNIKSPSAKRLFEKSLKDIESQYPHGPPVLDPINKMKIENKDLKILQNKIEFIKSKVTSNELTSDPNFDSLYALFVKKVLIKRKMDSVKEKIHNAQSIVQLDDLKHRKKVLKKLGFITNDEIINIKGRVACEISTGDELLTTELIFNGNFNDLSPEQSAALLSCFVFQEKTKETLPFISELDVPLKAMQSIAARIANVFRDCKIEINEKLYIESFRPELMEVVYVWCKGASFTQICKLTDVYEGSLIRMFKRLEELLRQLVNAAKIIGNILLQEKFENAMTMVHRNIVSAGSLYL